MKPIKIQSLAALLVCSLQIRAVAHSSVVPLSLNHAVGSPSLFDLSKLGKGPLSRVFSLSAGSGATRAFNLNLKVIGEATIKNTVLTTPLNNVSGQFDGTYYYGYASPPTTYYPEAGFLPFGSNPLNASSITSTNISNVANYISTGLKSGPVFPYRFAISGAQKAYQSDYNAVASSGYNKGLTILQHPTGGVLFGTTFPNGYGYPGFFAFGNSIYTSALLTQQANTSGLTLASLLQTYIQFGKFMRTFGNTLVVGPLYSPATSYPPFGTPMAGLFHQLYSPFAVATGSNRLNTGMYAPANGPLGDVSYFK